MFDYHTLYLSYLISLIFQKNKSAIAASESPKSEADSDSPATTFSWDGVCVHGQLETFSTTNGLSSSTSSRESSSVSERSSNTDDDDDTESNQGPAPELPSTDK